MELESERYVIGALIAQPQRFGTVDLLPEHFTRPIHRRMFEALLSLDAAGEAIDIITVRDQLDRDDQPEIIALARDYFGAANLEAHADRVRQAYQQRQAAEIAQRLTQSLGHDRDAIDTAISDLMALNVSRRNHEYTLRQALSSAVDHLDAVMHGEIRPGLSTGFEALDKKLGGLHDQDLVVIGGRPAMGKTAMGLRLALNAGVPVGFISGEQGYQQIAQRAIAIEGRVPLARMRNGQLHEDDWPKITSANGRLHQRAFRIFDKPSPTLADVRNVARAWKHHHGLGLLVIDYLQRMKGDARLPKHERVGEIVIGLKELARELEIPVVALAQVNRDVERRHEKRPNMADLKDSGDIEQEADQVMLLYRDDVYNLDSDQKGKAEILIDKNRHGPVGVIRVAWHQEWVRFDNLDERYIA